MGSKPLVLVLSSNNTKPKSLVKLITKSPPSNPESLELTEQNWALDTKYYTTEISFVGLETDTERTDEFNNRVEGIIIHLDANKETGLEDLKMWESIQNDCDAEIKILVANYCNDKTKITRTKAIEWCIARSFEFIELYPAKIETEDDYEEKVGVDRIIEALHSHTWSNIKLKSNKKIKDSDTKIESQDGDLKEEEMDEFTELFTQLHTMRESLSSLPMNQRKQCAEQMVTAFWKAIGGEEEELSDL